MRGEHITGQLLPALQPGSSPHARGTPRVTLKSITPSGIIPACAGNTRSRTARRSRTGDHPRMRGEHMPVGWKLAVSLGSSPHARGTPSVAGITTVLIGIIPACAGNTGYPIAIARRRWDHPRMRGEHITYGVEGANSQGSSPHARGTRRMAVDLPYGEGIIPACAGNTAFMAFSTCNRRDHPRMRGEHADNSSMTFNSEGSSPHARGTLMDPSAERS